jgi:hypothetical protein
MVGVLASSVVDCMFEPRAGQTKDYNIGICSPRRMGNNSELNLKCENVRFKMSILLGFVLLDL